MEQRCRRNLTEADKKVWIVVKITTLPLLELDFAGWVSWVFGSLVGASARLCVGWVLGTGVDPDLPEFVGAGLVGLVLGVGGCRLDAGGIRRRLGAVLRRLAGIRQKSGIIK